MTETTYLDPSYTELGKSITIDGIMFKNYRTGILKYTWISDNGQIKVYRNHNRETYSAYVIGNGPIITPSGKNKVFRSDSAAMIAGVFLWRRLHGQGWLKG